MGITEGWTLLDKIVLAGIGIMLVLHIVHFVAFMWMFRKR